MKKLFSPFKAVLSLGWLGLVILLLAGTIYWARYSQVSVPFDALQERMQVLNILEDDVRSDLNQMKLAEAYKIFMLQYDLEEDQDYAALAEESDQRINENLQALAEDDHFTADPDYYISDPSAELQDFNDLRSAHRQTFAQAVAAYQANDLEKASTLVEQMQDENDALDAALSAIVTTVDQDRLQAHRDFPADINQSIYMATGGLIIALLLALVGYQLISSAVRPLRSIQNTITAIEGDRYRPEAQGHLLKKRGPAGDLARALDQLAQGVQQRDAGLKTEIEQLRETLYESRRRRLKIYHDDSTNRSDPS